MLWNPREHIDLGMILARNIDLLTVGGEERLVHRAGFVKVHVQRGESASRLSAGEFDEGSVQVGNHQRMVVR